MTAMLDGDQTARLVSTGLDALDAVLGGLYWGDNVVWQLDSAPVAPFYAAIAAREEQFDTRLYIALSRPAQAPDVPGMTVIQAGPDTDLAHPADLLREIHRRCQPDGHRLLLFESLDTMVQTWSVGSTQGFFARCCPLLLNVGAIAYWSMSVRDSSEALRDTVQSVTQCILRVDDRSVRVTKAEGRPQGTRGSVLHWTDDDGRPTLEPADVIARVAASLRALRRTRGLSQLELAKLAGVTASAISQAERSERGLSLATLARLSAAVGVTIDDLLHGEDPETYTIGRRTDDPRHHLDRAITLLGDAASEVRVDLVRLDPREAGVPIEPRLGRGIVAVANGLVQVQIAGQTPAVRAGEVLVADSERVAGWRNIGQTEAILFWIVASLPQDQERLRSRRPD